MSVIAEHLYSLDNACEISGGLRWLNLGGAVRKRIRQKISLLYQLASLSIVASSSEAPLEHDLQISLSHDDPNSDDASILSTRSRSSVASELSTLWPMIPSSSRKMRLSVFDICSYTYIDATPNAKLSPIKELIVRKEKDGIKHEFLLILLAKPSGEEFWMRLERCRPPSGLSKLVFGALNANDIVSAVDDLHCSFIASPVRYLFQGNLVHC